MVAIIFKYATEKVLNREFTFCLAISAEVPGIGVPHLITCTLKWKF